MKPNFVPNKKTKSQPSNVIYGEYYDERTKTFLRAQQEAYSQANNIEFANELTYTPADSLGLDDPTLYHDNAHEIVTFAFSSYNNEIAMHKRQGDMKERTRINNDLFEKLNKSNQTYRKENEKILKDFKADANVARRDMRLSKLKEKVDVTNSVINNVTRRKYLKAPAPFTVRRKLT